MREKFPPASVARQKKFYLRRSCRHHHQLSPPFLPPNPGGKEIEDIRESQTVKLDFAPRAQNLKCRFRKVVGRCVSRFSPSSQCALRTRAFARRDCIMAAPEDTNQVSRAKRATGIASAAGRRERRAPASKVRNHQSTKKPRGFSIPAIGSSTRREPASLLARDRVDDALILDYPFPRRVHRTSTLSSRSPRVATSSPPRNRTTLPTAPRRPALRPSRRGRRTRCPRSRPRPRAPPSAPSQKLPPQLRRAPAAATSTRLRRSRWPSPPPPPRRPRRQPPPRRRRWRRASVPPTTSSCACSHRLPSSGISPRGSNPTFLQ